METTREWTFVASTPIPRDIDKVLAPGEQAVAAFKTFRDSAVFTTSRLIIRDAQGMSGKKVEMYSLPYSSIVMWSSENAGGMFDFSAELQLWTKVGPMKIKIGKGLDIRQMDQLIASHVL